MYLDDTASKRSETQVIPELPVLLKKTSLSFLTIEHRFYKPNLPSTKWSLVDDIIRNMSLQFTVANDIFSPKW